jgi:hypothetical protein
VAIDPKDLGELQKALNEAAGKASVLWTTFITFQLYLAVAFGSVTHRDLFLETSIKLPLLNVDLSLIGFFVVAPLLLLIFHFYLFLQLLGLASKAKDYNTLLVDEAPTATDRRYLRQRLDVFPILQFLAGPSDQRTGFRGYSLRLIAWITLVATPVLVLLQAQVTFLPYHREWIVWLQRVAVLIDLALIWYFWIHLRSDENPINGVLRKAWMCLGGGAGTLCVVIFSTYLATFPGEWINVLDQRYWDTHSSQPQGEEVRRKRAMFLADLACLERSAPYVARGLLENFEQNPAFLDADGQRLFTDRLLKGKSDPATCPGVRGFTDTDWADLSNGSSKTPTSR